MPTTDKYISKIELGNNLYIIKDADARKAIDTLTKAVVYKGVVDTTNSENKLIDGSTKTSVLLKDGTTLTVSNIEGIGSMVVQDQLEFIWNGTKWNELGSTGSLGKFAYVDEGEATVPSVTKTSSKQAFVSGKVSVSGTVAGQNAKVVGSVNITGINASEAAVATNSFRYTPRTKIKTGGSVEIETEGATKTSTIATGITGSGGSFMDDYFEAEEKLRLTFTAPSYKAVTGDITYKTGDPKIAYTAPTLENLGTDFAVTLNDDVEATVVDKIVDSSNDNVTLQSQTTYLTGLGIENIKVAVTPKTPTA